MEQKVSIVVPVYNAEKYLIRCLESIIKQTYRNFEMILINDCSTDQSLDLAKKFQKDNHTLEIILIDHKKNRGASTTRNSGIDASKGDYLFFVDADDELYSGTVLQDFLTIAEKEQFDFIIGGTAAVKDGKIIEKNYHRVKNTKPIYENLEILEGFLKGEWAVPPWNKLYRADFIKKNNLRFLPNLLQEDELWAFETAAAARKLGFLKKPTYTYYIQQGTDSLSRRVNLKNYRDLVFILRKKMEFVQKNNLYKKLPSSISYFENYARCAILGAVLKENKTVFIDFYKELKQIFTENNFPKHVFKTSPAIAYWAYKMKYDQDFPLYGKLPIIVNRFL